MGPWRGLRGGVVGRVGGMARSVDMCLTNYCVVRAGCVLLVVGLCRDAYRRCLRLRGAMRIVIIVSFMIIRDGGGECERERGAQLCDEL